MSISDLLLNASVLLLLLDIPVAVILVRAARKKPHIWALTLFALVSVGIAVLIVSYVAAATNALLGFPVPREVSQVGFRTAALVLGTFPPLFLWVYKTGRFRDGGPA